MPRKGRSSQGSRRTTSPTGPGHVSTRTRSSQRSRRTTSPTGPGHVSRRTTSPTGPGHVWRRTTSPTGPGHVSTRTTSPTGEEHVSTSADTDGLETWEDPTPRPSDITLKDLRDDWVAAAKRQLILRPKSPSRTELIRRRQEHDRKSLMIALDVYAKQNDVQSNELELIEVKKRNLIDEEGKGYVHFNFLVKNLDDTFSLFFAEVHPDCKEEQDVYLCSLLEENDSGHCFGCNDRAKDLKHPSTAGYLGGHKDVGFPFMFFETSDEESEDEN